MNTKDAHRIFLLLAILLGGGLRFIPVIMAGFPVNDGGMFYIMAEELKTNNFALPAFTGYNLANIPFAYPPLGLYVTSLISAAFRTPALDVIRWLPALVSTFSLLAFYLMADEILESKTQAALATLFYGLLPDSFGWAIMGGGITRAFGLTFMFLTIAYANRLFSRPPNLPVPYWVVAAQTAFFGALAVLSHPETGLHAAATCILLWFFRGRNKKTLLWSAGVAGAVLILTAPWWGNVLAQHGLAPFRSALHTSDDGTFHLAKLLTLGFGGGPFFSLTVAFGCVGLLGALAQRKFLLPTWLVLPFFVDPRGAVGLVLLPIAMLGAYGFDQMIAPATLSLRGVAGPWLRNRFATLAILAIFIYSFFGAGLFGVGLAGSSLSAADRETIAWVDENIPPGNDFLLLTGVQYSMQDPFQEWFPALTNQRSQTTLQGLEWTLGADFFPFYGELVSLQNCPDETCISDWGKRTGLGHGYLLVRVLPRENLSLITTLRGSSGYEVIYETGEAVIFKTKKR